MKRASRLSTCVFWLALTAILAGILALVLAANGILFLLFQGMAQP